jgi:hypothetical protein
MESQTSTVQSTSQSLPKKRVRKYDPSRIIKGTINTGQKKCNNG